MAFRYFKGPGQATALSAWGNTGGSALELSLPAARKRVGEDRVDDDVPDFGAADLDALTGVENVLHAEPRQRPDADENGPRAGQTDAEARTRQRVGVAPARSK